MRDQIEIRRIADEDGHSVAELWDRMCREVPDGGALTERGKANIARRLAMSAWHEQAFCLVATAGSRVVGFVNGRTDTADGLLPGVLGVVESRYVLPEFRGMGTGRRLLEAAIGWLRDHGAGTIRTQISADDTEARRLWLDLGFEPDMVVLSLYG